MDENHDVSIILAASGIEVATGRLLSSARALEHDRENEEIEIFSRPKILTSDENCRLDEGIFDAVPMLFDKTGLVIHLPTAWFRHLAVNLTSFRSIYQYATSICIYWNYLTVNKIDWSGGSDRTLRVWRNQLADDYKRRSAPREKATINAHLECVLRFYRWAQEYGHVLDLIGQTPPGGQPYPIRLVRRRIRKALSLTSDLLFKIPRKPRKPIPTSLEIGQLFVILGGPSAINERNCLMCKWATGSGLRRFEILGLSIESIPSFSECLRLKDEDRVAFIRIIGKNGTEREVPVLPEILLETHDFFTYSRPEILGDLKSFSTKEIFTGNSGTALNEQYVSHLMSDAFRKLGDRKLVFHRLRARFASRLVQHLRAEEEQRFGRGGARDETILERAAQYLGHADIETLRFYLNLDLDAEEVAVRSAMRASISTRALTVTPYPPLASDWIAPSETSLQ